MTVTKPLLFTPIKVGALTLAHRVAMAPLTRFRANPKTFVPSPLSTEYYRQRASPGGLMISEATFVAEEAGGFAGAPGIWSQEQVAQWKEVTEAVHAKGGLIFLQLWALGRVANPKLVKTVVGPSAKPYLAGNVTTANTPTAPAPITPLTEADIERYVGHYAHAASNAIAAGFDGVEIHGANGYLLDQFLQTVVNDRTDAYGGSLANRFRFPLAVLNAVSAAIGPERVGLRLSPFNNFQGMREPVPLDTFEPWMRAVVAAQPHLAYIHAVEARGAGASASDAHAANAHPEDDLAPIRRIVQDAGITFIAAGGYSPETALRQAESTGDVVAFGRHFISNPDLPERIANGWDLSPYDRGTFYVGAAKGYTDYPDHEAKL